MGIGKHAEKINDIVTERAVENGINSSPYFGNGSVLPVYAARSEHPQKNAAYSSVVWSGKKAIGSDERICICCGHIFPFPLKEQLFYQKMSYVPPKAL